MVGFPAAWFGVWVADDGRVVLIERVGGGIACTVAPGVDQPPFLRSQLPDTYVEMARQTARWTEDAQHRWRLQIEAGHPGVGPTYDLHFMVDQSPDSPRQASGADDVTEIRAYGSPGMGLYDDWDDDLGVPWAYPLTQYKKGTAAVVAAMIRRLDGISG